MSIDKALESIKSIKLKGGIFGKTITLLIVLCICVATVCVAASMWQITLLLMFPLMILVFYGFKRCIDFAEKNPYAAIMDGAELLIHDRLLHGRKGQDEIPTLEATVDHELPMLDEATIMQEDPPVTLELEDTPSSNHEGGK